MPYYTRKQIEDYINSVPGLDIFLKQNNCYEEYITAINKGFHPRANLGIAKISDKPFFLAFDWNATTQHHYYWQEINKKWLSIKKYIHEEI